MRGYCNDALLKKKTRGRWSCVGATSVIWTIHEIIDYTPVNSNSQGKSPFYLGRTASNGPFSIARLNLQVKKRSTEVSICYQARKTFDRFLRSSQNLARLVWHPFLLLEQIWRHRTGLLVFCLSSLLCLFVVQHKSLSVSPKIVVISPELTYPTLGKGKSSSKCHFWGIC